MRAGFAGPTGRHGHGVLDDAPEWGVLEAELEGQIACPVLPGARVFGDIVPRLAVYRAFFPVWIGQPGLRRSRRRASSGSGSADRPRSARPASTATAGSGSPGSQPCIRVESCGSAPLRGLGDFAAALACRQLLDPRFDGAARRCARGRPHSLPGVERSLREGRAFGHSADSRNTREERSEAHVLPHRS
jgi:hypothetical protein